MIVMMVGLNRGEHLLTLRHRALMNLHSNIVASRLTARFLSINFNSVLLSCDCDSICPVGLMLQSLKAIVLACEAEPLLNVFSLRIVILDIHDLLLDGRVDRRKRIKHRRLTIRGGAGADLVIVDWRELCVRLVEDLAGELGGVFAGHLLLSLLPVSVFLDDTRSLGSQAIVADISALHITHLALLRWADGAMVVEGWDVLLAVEAIDLQPSKLDIKVGDEILEDVSTLRHQFRGLLVCQHLLYVLFRPLKVGEEQNENLLRVARDLNQVDDLVDHVEVAVEDLASHVDPTVIEADVHGRRTLFGNDVDFIWTICVGI